MTQFFFLEKTREKLKGVFLGYVCKFFFIENNDKRRIFANRTSDAFFFFDNEGKIKGRVFRLCLQIFHYRNNSKRRVLQMEQVTQFIKRENLV